MTTSNTLYKERLDWKGHGYHAAPIRPAELAREPQRASWLRVQEILDQARSGRLDRIPELLDVYGEAPGVLQDVCIRILGDAGDDRCFERMIAESSNPLDPERGCDFASALRAWGSLSAVPVLCRIYETFYGFQDAEPIPLFISSLLEPEWGPLSTAPRREDDLDGYLAAVARAYEQTKARLGSEDVIVLLGEPFSAAGLARQLLAHLGRTPFDIAFQSYGRRKFEATTGLDCTSFFADGLFQPLSAAAILERFLHGPLASTFLAGRRYFFGHEIPASTRRDW